MQRRARRPEEWGVGRQPRGPARRPTGSSRELECAGRRAVSRPTGPKRTCCSGRRTSRGAWGKTKACERAMACPTKSRQVGWAHRPVGGELCERTTPAKINLTKHSGPQCCVGSHLGPTLAYMTAKPRQKYSESQLETMVREIFGHLSVNAFFNAAKGVSDFGHPRARI